MRFLQLLLPLGVAVGDHCTDQILVASATRPRVGLPACIQFLSSLFEVSLQFYQSDIQSKFTEWTAMRNVSSTIHACVPGTCSEEHIPAVAYLVCLMVTQEPRCVEMLQISSPEAEIVGFAKVSAVLLIQGMAVQIQTWFLTDWQSSNAREALIEASTALVKKETELRRKERQVQRELQALREQKLLLQGHFTTLVDTWNQLLGQVPPVLLPEEVQTLERLSSDALGTLSDLEVRTVPPVPASSQARHIFPGAGELQRSTVQLRGVCLRDRTSATEFHSPFVPAAVLTGRRIEVVFQQLVEIGLFHPHHRFVARNVTAEEFAVVWKTADEHWSGLTRFVHDGHSPSQRCPDCANIGHFLLDDMLIDVVARVANQDISDLQVQRTVANLHSNLGAAGVKRFQEDFVSTVFESPTIFMGVDEVHCFEAVILSANPRQRTGGFEELLQGRPGKPWQHYSPETLFRQVRAHYHLTAQAAQARELVDPSVPLPEVLLDARRGASRRVFASAEELAKLVGATLFDFAGKSWTSRVRSLSAAKVYIGVYGGQLFQLPLMHEGSLVLVLTCQILQAHWHATFLFRFLRLSGLELQQMEHDGCLALPPSMEQNALAETRLAPVMKLAADIHPISRLANSDIVLLHKEFLCAFRRPEAKLDFEREAETAGNPEVLEVLWGGLGVALRRCAEWHMDCEVAAPISSDGRGWALLANTRYSDSLGIPHEELAIKIDCVVGEFSSSESAGLYRLENTFAPRVYDHLVTNVTTSSATVERIRQLVSKHQGYTPWRAS
ncbi:unnamed protein product [Symbiodinium sp. CCMP2592]|nr:unnamed protein product [Symbiodinium sp. CCMP2592]